MDSQIFNNVSLAISITGARNRGGHQSSLMKIISTVGSSRREPLRLVMAVAFIRKLALTLSMDTVLRFYRLVQYSSSGRISELYMPISFRISPLVEVSSLWGTVLRSLVRLIIYSALVIKWTTKIPIHKNDKDDIDKTFSE